MSSTASPVHVDASLQPGLSRGLWLVKWILAIPHYVVLVFLWIAFIVLTAVALVAIVTTGRYPRSLFDFNVGVLRWTWRVGYYAYSALGTDRYPPFTLDERADYPAHLDIAYPDTLSRGLVLVKWWLLAIPHYLVLALFLGGGWQIAPWWSGDRVRGPGLIELLVLVAGVLVLFTGRYPRDLHDLVVGLNRWVLRVVAYAALMTDQYPPFRLDLGGAEGERARTTSPAPSALPSPSSPVTVPGSRSWGAGRVAAVVVTSLALITSLAILTAGTAAAVFDRTARNAEGYLATSEVRLHAPGHALTTEALEIGGGGASLDLPERLVGTVRVSARLEGADVFVGVADSDAAATYLSGVAYSTLREPIDDADGPTYDDSPGGPPSVPPQEAGIWAESAVGSGRQEIAFVPREGSWTVVVMRADGNAPVEPWVTAGATVPLLDDIALGLLAGGFVMLVVGSLGLWLALRRT